MWLNIVMNDHTNPLDFTLRKTVIITKKIAKEELRRITKTWWEQQQVYYINSISIQ